MPTPASRVAATIAASDAEAVLPRADDQLAVLDAASVLDDGRLVASAWCVTASNTDEALASVTRRLEADGWRDLHTAGQGARRGLVGRRDDFRINASISAAPARDCSPADGKFFIAVRLQKLIAATPAAPSDPAP